MAHISNDIPLYDQRAYDIINLMIIPVGLPSSEIKTICEAFDGLHCLSSYREHRYYYPWPKALHLLGHAHTLLMSREASHKKIPNLIREQASKDS